MKLIRILAAAASIFAAAPAFSAMVTIDFEGTTSFSSVNNFYNGGTDGEGASGTNYGISFSGSALGLVNDGMGAASDGRYFSNQPSGVTVMFAPDTPTVMNVASGFAGAVAFYYSSKTNLPSATTVTVYDGANGTGNVVATSVFASNSDAAEAFDNWSLASLTFSGIGRSVSFSDNGGYTAYDNVTVNAVPLPAALLLFPFGVAGLGFVARRKRAAR